MTTIHRMKRVLAACGMAALLSLTPPASAADFGLGVFMSGHESTIAAPIRLESLLIEPELTWFRTSSNTQDARFTTLGVGVYLRKELGPLFEAYYGARAGYTMSKSSTATPSETKSWLIAPTFGVQHFLSKQFSIGIDAALQYSQTNSNNRDDFATQTRVLLRAYF